MFCSVGDYVSDVIIKDEEITVIAIISPVI